MACGNTFVLGLSRVNFTVSPSMTRTTGPGNWPLKVQALYFMPPPSTTNSVSTAVILTSWVFADAGSTRIVWLPTTMRDRAVTNESHLRSCLDTNNMCASWSAACCDQLDQGASIDQWDELKHDLDHARENNSDL